MTSSPTNKDVTDNANNKLMRLSTYFTVFGVFLIIIAKLYGWFITESVTMLASLTDSLLDICVSIMNLITVHYSLKPADHEHRFGHGKAEDLAVFIQSSFFGASGLYLIFVSLERLFEPTKQLISHSSIGIATMVFSILITLVILSFQHYVMKRVSSNVIKADSLHYLTDLLTNIVAIIGIFLVTYWNIPMFDSIAALAIALYIIVIALKMFKKAFNNLMDHELDEKDRELIIKIIKSHKQVLGFHDLKTRYAGNKPFIQFHLEMDENMPFKQTHKIAIEIEKMILEKIPNAEIIIHQDPEGVEEKVFYKD
jgi:ferrous-iron efflux pump FieF